MEPLVQRSHAAMVWLLGLGLIAAWAAYDQPPPVVDTAYAIVLQGLPDPAMLGLPEDPLAKLRPAAQAPLAQYRHEFMRHGMLYREQLCGLEPIPVEAVLALARQVLDQCEQSSQAANRRKLLLGSLRRDLAALETWHVKSGLSASASLVDVQNELGSKLQIPGTEQAITVQQCMAFVGIGLVAVQLYLTSLFSTLAVLPRDDASCDRGWVVLHRAPLGPILTTLWLVLPCLAWLVEHILLPLDRREPWPGLSTWVLAGAIASTMLAMLWKSQLVRRRHLPTTGEVV